MSDFRIWSQEEGGRKTSSNSHALGDLSRKRERPKKAEEII